VSRVEYKPFGSKDIKATAKNDDKRDVTSIISFSRRFKTAAGFESANLRSLVHYSTNFPNDGVKLLLNTNQSDQKIRKNAKFIQ
jgi:hypothetical protein